MTETEIQEKIKAIEDRIEYYNKGLDMTNEILNDIQHSGNKENIKFFGQLYTFQHTTMRTLEWVLKILNG